MKTHGALICKENMKLRSKTQKYEFFLLTFLANAGRKSNYYKIINYVL